MITGMKGLTYLNVAAMLLAAGTLRGAVGAQPVYIYLHARITDHLNLDISEQRLRRLLPLLEKYRKQHPESGVSATILFSGAASQALADGNKKTGIKDLVQDYVRRGVIEVGYDGSDEPGYQRRSPDVSKTKDAEQRWLARGEAAGHFLSDGRNPLTGAVEPSRAGGLRQMQAIFGEAACIAGLTEELGGNPEYVQQLGRYNHNAIMFGFLDPDPNPAKGVPGFRESLTEFAREMSPVPESSRELYWEDHILRSSETSDANIRRVSAYEGHEVLKELLTKLDRSKVRILHLELGDQRMYLREDFAKGKLYPPVRYGYEHPENPKLPVEARRIEAEVSAAYANEEAALRWLLDDYFATNPGSRFVSSANLRQMTPPSAGFSVSVGKLREALGETLKIWDDNTTYPPMYMLADGHYLSLADMFQVMTDALAELHRSGKLPQSVQVVRVYGPVPMPDDRGTNNGIVTVASIAQVCNSLAGALHDTSASALPKNRVPSRVVIEGMDLNAGQFLRLMSKAIIAGVKDAKVNVRMTQMHSVSGWSVPTTRIQEDQSASWTYKPAPLNALAVTAKQ